MSLGLKKLDWSQTTCIDRDMSSCPTGTKNGPFFSKGPQLVLHFSSSHELLSSRLHLLILIVTCFPVSSLPTQSCIPRYYKYLFHHITPLVKSCSCHNFLPQQGFFLFVCFFNVCVCVAKTSLHSYFTS